ncbi:hypothetical protein BU16DRAFT_164707 [Lophium mytilinum]|uniref:SH3 domain-containing protein n=1 Tax=Lophium mytilinum TaxID=390894 RepID=A0A6A6QC08_9PEZI|nr:hypothetical protein BU16DRAFT_164707 [Lophium mytilinum]
MTRPHIIRADTLDLQEKTSPTAQDHSRQPARPAPLGIGPAAPHQAAAVKQADDERAAEDANLQKAWDDSGAALREDPGSDDETTLVSNADQQRQDEQAIRMNGGMSNAGDDGDMADGDMDDMDDDDDMMDKISSSPSIDDGVYSLPTSWPPRRSSSLSPDSTPTPTRYSKSDTPSPSLDFSSSPYRSTPIHLPLVVSAGQDDPDTAAGTGARPTSSLIPSPTPFPSSLRSRLPQAQSPSHLHRGRKYTPLEASKPGARKTVRFAGITDATSTTLPQPQPDYLSRIDAQLQSIRQDSNVSLVKFDSGDLRKMLLPSDDPLLEGSDIENGPELERSDMEDGPELETISDVEDGPELQTSDIEDCSELENGSDVDEYYLIPPKIDRRMFPPGEFKVVHTPHPTPPGSPTSSDASWITDSDADSALDMDYSGDDDDSDVSFSEDPRFIDSGWGGECLRYTEDIDFEFVYALHTFVATVEGQANATKGDTMVLLDDSNSYWWLVRVVKDSSIGYLPAEHIETPTERLARLNKHRNIDLSATMLGDTAEKTKNPLKKAMRRRNAKTVQFTAPTYVEASDYDYSSDEDDDQDDSFEGTSQQTQVEATQNGQEPEQEDALAVQPLKINGAKKDVKSSADSIDAPRDSTDELLKESDKQRTSDEMFDRPLDPKVSRNGTLRNTDSFFKDDNAETRKITLTPNILRDDSSGSTTRSFETKERGPSLESLEKNGFADKTKDEKKKKEKKPGMLSGLFKRKDKKTKTQDPEGSDTEKVSEELGRGSPQSKNSDDSPTENSMSEKEPAVQPQRNPSKGKLQKAPRNGDVSPPKNAQNTSQTASPEPTVQLQPAPLNSKPNGQQNPGTMRLVSPEPEHLPQESVQGRIQSPESRAESQRSRSNSSASKLTPLTNMLGRSPNEPRPEKVKKAKQRVQLDDFDSSADDEKADPFADPHDGPDETSQRCTDPSDAAERLSESPVHVSPRDAQPPENELSSRGLDHDAHNPPDLTGDTSSQDSGSPISTPSLRDSPSTSQPSAPNLIASRPTGTPSPTTLTPPLTNVPAAPSRPAPIPTHEMQHSPPPSSTASLPAWSDASLRTYLDDGSDIRDMLLVVHDTSGVVPVGPEHPIMAGLFQDERSAVKDMGGRLDSLLSEWLVKKRKKQLSATIPAR